MDKRRRVSMQAICVLPEQAPAAACGQRGGLLLASLSPEIWISVASFLASYDAQGDVATLTCSSAVFHRLLSDEAAWRGFLLNRFRGGAAGALPFNGSWRNTVLCSQGGSCPTRSLGRQSSANFLFAGLRLELSRERLRHRKHLRAHGIPSLRRQLWRTKARPVSAEEPCWLDAKKQLAGLFAGWPGSWTGQGLGRRFAGRSFDVTLPGAGQVFRMRLRDFLHYAASNADFLPPRWDAESLYLFDPKPPLALRALRPPQLSAAPDLARQCRGLAKALATVTRGWLLIGGAGSGSRFHIDAYGCGAWSVCLEGRKRWALYPPGSLPPGVIDMGPGRFASPSPVFWFSEVLPSLLPAQRPPIDLVTQAGDLLYIPPGWWHCVLNLTTPCVAFTRNVAYGLRAASTVAAALNAAGRPDE
ncbi:unnamed protein product, partial [Symbiodinium sp. CCMP2456]